MSKLTALGCHIYAGGFTLGVLDAGFKVLGHLEESNFGVETVKHNLGLEVRVGQEAWRPHEFKDQVDWLYGNPPCASWSQAGHKIKDRSLNAKRWSHDERTKCTERLFGLIPEVRPRVFTWESVAAAMKNGLGFVDARCEDMKRQGYHVYRLLFNGHDAGLPQTRRRFFFVASKVQLDFEHPAKFKTVRYATPREAWKQLHGKIGPKTPKVPWLKVLKTLPRDGTHQVLSKHFNKSQPSDRDFIRNPKTGYVLGRPGFLYVRIAFDKPAPTIPGGEVIFHPTQLRTLTVLEQQVLCGYPKDYTFVGNPSNQYAQIGKAVLPPAARWLGHHVRRGLLRGKPVRPGVTDHNFFAALEDA